ncbi:MAG: type II toxin-antitoxin system RelE/ParE family toxin [Methanomassiliicoccales archaeon]|nr:type II toxin-antitoxin system RelE/ParE family toxin [Methanomassiliicoccales archaeon]
MTYEVLFSDLALKQLRKLERNYQERIVSTLERIRIRPDAYVRKLVGNEGYRLRVGDFRLILDLDRDKLIVLVLKIGHRKNVYNK